MKGVRIIRALVKFLPEWLPENRVVVDALVEVSGCSLPLGHMNHNMVGLDFDGAED